MTKLGAHICTGERNGYSDFITAKPRVVTAVGEGGALIEAKEKSGGHAVTIYRDISVYLEAPGDINSLPSGITIADAARYWYGEHEGGGLRQRWQMNPADYYTITNEQGGDDLPSLRNLVAYEREVMKLANADGFKVCVLCQAGGSPGDFELWKDLLAPFILEAWAAGNIYGRHAYGFPDLVDQSGNVLAGNPYRPIKEIEYLNSLGARGGMAIKECGLDGGFGFAGLERFTFQMTNYEKALRPYEDIIGICMWNLGSWQASDANWQAAIPRFTPYMQANPTTMWAVPDPGVAVEIKPEDKLISPLPRIVEPAEDETPIVQGLELTHWRLDQDRCDFRIHGDIWFAFHYGNSAGRGVPYGGMGALILKWDGNQLSPYYYQHSYSGTLKMSGGPGPDATWIDHWRPDDVGIFAIAPFLTFDAGAKNKRNNPENIDDGHIMGPATWVQIGSRLEPGSLIKPPEGAIGKKKAETEPEKEKEAEQVAPKQKDEPYDPVASGRAGGLRGHMMEEGLKNRVMALNPMAALQKAIFADGYLPTSREFWTSYEGSSFAGQMAENLTNGERRVYFAEVDDWNNIHYVTNAPPTKESEEGVIFGADPFAPRSRLRKLEPPPTPRLTEEVKPEPAKPEVVEKPQGFQFERWPTSGKTVTQYFGENPEDYQKFKLPGHEGVDIAAPMGTPYFAAAPGTVLKVTDKRWDGSPSAYGWHVILDHGNGYTTLYAHATPDIPVAEGDLVAAGQIVGFSGNTGNSSGPHLHITVQKKGTQLPGWPAGYVDPWPLLEPLYETIRPPAGDLVEGYLFATSLDVRSNNLAITTLKLNMREKPDSASMLLFKIRSGATVRILNPEKVGTGYYLCEASALDAEKVTEVVKGIIDTTHKVDMLNYIGGDGRIYEVKNANGGQERFQSQWDGSTFYQTKNQNWEQFIFDNDFIYRDVDTSPGGDRYYRLTDPDRKKGSRWVRRHMAVGETFQQSRLVQFYNDQSGEKQSAFSGNVTDTIKLAAHHDELTFRTGLTIKDVLELHWVNGGEKYFYAKNFGLVGWERIHFDPATPAWSAIAEIHEKGSREDNKRRWVAGL